MLEEAKKTTRAGDDDDDDGAKKMMMMNRRRALMMTAILATGTNVIGDDDGAGNLYDSIDFSGVAFNPNRGYSPTYGSRLYSFTEYYRNNVEDNSTVLQTVYELTYEIYVELIERLNPVGVRSLNYPRGDVK